jgi:exodeoxyribonuclease VII small subunit
MTTKAPKKTYQSLRAELDEVLLQLQDPTCDVEAAAALYERGLALIADLKTRLQTVENTIQKLTDTP